MVSTPVVDIEVDPLDERRRRRRVLLRIGIPLGGVALMIATILFIAFYADGRTATAPWLFRTICWRRSSNGSG